MERNIRALSRVLMIVCTLSVAVPASQMYAWSATDWMCNRAQEMYWSAEDFLCHHYKAIIKRVFSFGAGAVIGFLAAKYWDSKNVSAQVVVTSEPLKKNDRNLSASGIARAAVAAFEQQQAKQQEQESETNAAVTTQVNAVEQSTESSENVVDRKQTTHEKTNRFDNVEAYKQYLKDNKGKQDLKNIYNIRHDVDRVIRKAEKAGQGKK